MAFFSRKGPIGWALATMLLALPARGEDRPAPAVLEIGVLPYLNIQGLVQTYGPLAAHLESLLGQPVRVVTAKDYPQFVAATAAKSYPIVITASHFARLAEKDSGYIPILRPLTDYYEMLVVRADDPANRIEDLAEAVIAVPDLLAQVSMMGLARLRHHGLAPTAANFVVAGSHKNAVHAVLSGAARAAVVSEGGFRHMDDESKRGVREIPPLPGDAAVRKPAIPVIYMLNPDLPEAVRRRYTDEIARFTNETPAGQAWIAKLDYRALRPVTAADMTSLDAHVAELRPLLQHFAR